MNPRDIRTSSDPDIAATVAAMLEAARIAEDLAIQTNTAIITTINGSLVRITADELKARRLRQAMPDGLPPEGGVSP